MAENHYDLDYTGSMVDRILDTGYDLQNQGYIFRGLASHYTGTPTERTWLIAPTGSTGFGLSSPVPPGSIGICMYNGSSWSAEVLNTLTLDSAPTTGSGNGITSGAVKTLAESITNAIGQLEQSVSDRFTSMELEDTTGSLQAEVLSITLKYVFEGEEETLTSLSILAATAEKAGLMSAADKQKLDAFVTNIRSLRIQDTTAQADQGTELTNTLKWTIEGVTEAITAFTLYAATTSKAGLMSAADKNALDTLPSLINAGYLYAGIATPSTVPSSTSAKIYYIAIEGGTYTNFGNLNVTQGINIIYKSGDAWSVAQVVGIDNEPTAGSDNLVKSCGVLNKLYNPYFSEINDENIYQIKALYLEGLDVSATYYGATTVYNNSKYITILDSSKNLVAQGSVNSDTLVVLNEVNNSGISGYCLIENTDIVHITSANACTINNSRVSKMSEDIRLALNKVDFPIFGNKEIFSDYFAAEMYGYPYLIPTQDQFENEPTLNALRGLSLSGLDNTKKYYLKFNHGSTTHFIDIYDETKTTILARGNISVSDSIIAISEYSSGSGISGKAKLHFSDASLLTNTYTLINTHTTAINANHIEPIIGEMVYLQNNVFGNALKELYFEGLNQNSEYRIRAYKGSSYTQFQVLLGGTSNLVAAGTILGNPSKLDGIFELSPVNGSNIHGYINYKGDNIAANTDRGVINNAVVSDMENSPSIKKYEEDNPVIVSPNGGYSSSLLRGIIKAETFMDKTVIVDAGEYDLEAEFKEYYGDDFFTNYTYDATKLGIHLKNRVHVIFSSGAKVVFNYSGDNADVKQYFSPFNAMPASSDCYGFTLENLTLEASNCRYCVHDERNAKTDSYTNKYINCYMKIDNTNNSYGYNCCIGGGLGKNGYIEVRGCRFESADTVNIGSLVSWHNSPHTNAKSKIVCHNNYIEGKGTFRFSWHGTSTLMTEVLVDGNSLGADVIVRAETGNDTIINVNVTQWNNEIRE